jgi:hypothetical protein
MKKKSNIKQDDFDTLTSVWILSCNDENSIISYEGIKHRLSLEKSFNLKMLIESRRELFRTNVPLSRIEEWKMQMLQGKRLPAWLKLYKSEDRINKINSLTTTDCFRCQFRTENRAPKAPLEIIDWGLKHIDRLRKAEFETTDFKIKKWTNIWIPLVSLIVALSSVLSSVYMQQKTQETQVEMKKYEISFKPKQLNYSAFIGNLFYAFESARQMNPTTLRSNLDRIEISYYNIEPFLNKELRENIWEQFQQFSAMCYTYNNVPYEERTDSLKSKYIDSFIWYKNYFKENLYPALFEKESENKLK